MSNYRYQYIIGDLQGCYQAFNQLLQAIDFDDSCDHIYLCGDIVARGENSLATLRKVKQLSDKGALSSVLGNHDITLIATWLGVLPPKPKDKTAPIFAADDCDELLDWLRHRPLYLLPDDDSIVVHAGIPHIWTDAMAMAYADEVHVLLRGELDTLKKVLPKLYNKDIEPWRDDVKGAKRLCLITNYFTRMRAIDKNGTLEFSYTDNPKDSKLPTTYHPWYDYPSKSARRIYFGHWAALVASIDTADVCALDGGAVWGGALVAYRLQDGQVFCVKNPII